MSDQRNGILPFGSDDSSIILQCSLTSLAECQALGGAELNAGRCTFDSLKGVSANATNGGVRFTTPAGYQALSFAGQISFEIQTKGIAVTSGALLSTGDTQAGNAYVFVMDDGSTANYLRFYVDANERTNLLWTTASVSGGTSPGASAIEITSFGKGEFTRYTLSWIGNTYAWYVDGVHLFSGNRNGMHTGSIGNRINVMSSGGLGSAILNVYMRNLVVSTRPVYGAVHPYFNKLAIVGHSFAARSSMWVYNNSWRDMSMGLLLRKFFLERGIDVHMPNDSSGIFGQTGATTLNSGGTPINTQVGLAAAWNPSAVLYLGYTNDVVNPSWAVNRAQTLVDLKGHITTLMGTSNCKRMVVANAASVIADASNWSGTFQDRNTVQGNDDIATIEDWWDDNNPTRRGMVKVLDAYSLLGGSNPPAEYFWGSALGTYNDKHPTPPANVVLARGACEKFMSML